VFQAFEAERGRDWAAEFRRSSLCAKYVTGEMAAVAPANLRRPPGQAPRTRNRLSQLSTLTRRYLSVIASDRMYLGILAGVPIILAAIVRLLGGKQGLTADVPGTNTSVTAVLLILAIGGCFTGAFNAIREIVKEREIYARERAAGLSSTAYLWSKLIVLGTLSALQAALMTVIGLAGERMPPRGVVIGSPLLELAVEMALLAIASMTVGLLISSAVNTAEKGLPLLLVSVIMQVVFTGGVISLVGKVGLEQLAWISPSRWGFAAIASTTHLSVIMPIQPGTKPDPLWTPTSHHWFTDMGLLVVLAAVYSFITWRRLVKQGPRRRR
jgi:ABC transport system ATP-binding/permease protein